ncbi:MAG: ferritin-like domain-containing protein [Fimbriimonadaceae bacterium]|nr:ferritin-like domain-containing protein [Fimbriimonadaceae bacterium]
MSDRVTNLKELFVEELRDLYNAEHQILKALPKMKDAASNDRLKRAFGDHLEQTKQHVSRLEEVFEELGEDPKGKHCKAMEGLIKEGSEMIAEKADPDVKDAGLIAAAQRVEHYEMAGYGCVRTYAKHLGLSKIQRTLQTTLDEEGATDKHLTDIAVGEINREAMAAR